MIFDLPGVDVDAAGDDHVGLARLQIDVTVGVDSGQIAHREVSVESGFVGGRRVFVIAADEHVVAGVELAARRGARLATAGI